MPDDNWLDACGTHGRGKEQRRGESKDWVEGEGESQEGREEGRTEGLVEEAFPRGGKASNICGKKRRKGGSKERINEKKEVKNASGREEREDTKEGESKEVGVSLGWYFRK
jgi:hypothetical protein